MTLLDPLTLVWGLLALPIVVLYWRRTRAQRQAVAAGMVWQRVFDPPGLRFRWQPWRHSVSRAIQVLILLSIVLAAAEPMAPPPRRTVLVLDSSAGLDQARQSARAWIGSLGCRDQAAVLSAGGPLKLHCGLTGRRDLLEAAIDGVKPVSTGPSRLDDAVALGRQLLEFHDADASQIVVLGGDHAAENRFQPAWIPAIPLWVFPVVLVVVLLAVEWCLFQRRWIC